MNAKMIFYREAYKKAVEYVTKWSTSNHIRLVKRTYDGYPRCLFVDYRLGYMRHDTLDSMESLEILFANGEIVAFNGFVEISGVARFLLYNDELQHECMTEPSNLKA
jgi:hypothetical protein